MPLSKPPEPNPNRATDTRPVANGPGGARPAAARPSAADPARKPSPDPQSGVVTHDTRGNAVWRWAASVGAQMLESTSRLLKRLEVPELKVDEKPKGLELEERNPGGGYDPYNRGKGSGRKR